jgi:hypothetical protein
MPFTPAHPAAVLPLRNRFPRALPWAALVIGSMTPDFKYFLLGLSHAKSHTLPGLFLFCLPAGITSWLLFQFLMKRPLTLLAPRADATRLWALAVTPVRVSLDVMLSVALAILVSASTHLIWDSFTHADGWIVKHVAALSRSIVTIDGYEVTVSKVLQHGSSIAGLLLLARAYAHWRRNAAPAQNPPVLPPAWKGLALVLITVPPAIAAIAYSGIRAAPANNLATLQPFVWRLVTSALAFGILALVVYSCVLTFAMTRSATTPR